jgi:hypothetical protein
MKDIIKRVLDRQGNLASESFRKMLAMEIEAVLLNEGRKTNR